MADIAIDGLKVCYGDAEILQSVSFEMTAGNIVALLGASGSGKTTLLRAIAGLERPSEGRITIDGQTLFDSARGIDLAPEARGLGLVFQSYALWPHKSVAENIGYPLKLRGIGRAERDGLVRKALTGVGLASLGERFPHQLSGGQQQRVALARALIYAPKVILLDEPLSNLDARLREDARLWLRRLIGERGLSAICVTHDQLEAMALAHRILLLDGGRIVQDGSPRDIYRHPLSLFAADFMGSNNRLVGRVSAIEDKRVALEVAGESFSGIACGAFSVGQEAIGILRSEAIRLLPAESNAGRPATIVDLLYLGEKMEIVCRVGAVTLHVFSSDEPGSLAECRLAYDASALWVYPAS